MQICLRDALQPKHLHQCLANSRCSINICWWDEQKWEWNSGSFWGSFWLHYFMRSWACRGLRLQEIGQVWNLFGTWPYWSSTKSCPWWFIRKYQWTKVHLASATLICSNVHRTLSSFPCHTRNYGLSTVDTDLLPSCFVTCLTNLLPQVLTTPRCSLLGTLCNLACTTAARCYLWCWLCIPVFTNVKFGSLALGFSGFWLFNLIFALHREICEMK